MSQFDVYNNPSKATRSTYPYIIDVQSHLISGIATRIVIPLVRLRYFENEKMQGLTPEIEYKGESLLLLTPQISSIPTTALKTPIGSLEHYRREIISALDFAITGI